MDYGHYKITARKQKDANGPAMKIVFLGTHGQYNIGDELLLETFLRQLGKENHYAVNSYDPEFTHDAVHSQFDVKAFHTTHDSLRFIWYILTCDLVFFGGGSIIKELYASVGRNRFITLWMILATVTFAKTILRKRVVMSNIGIGPIMSPTGETLARWIIKQVDYVSVRDQNSIKICMRLGIPASKVLGVSDAVFANPPEIFLKEPTTRHSTGEIRIALNLNYDIEKRSAWEGFLSSLAESLNALNRDQRVVIEALPMQSRFKKNDDLTVLKTFHEQIPEIEMIYNNPQTPQAVAEIMARCDLVLAERLHALVIASIIGIPFYGLIYDIKVHELVEYLGMEKYSININETFEGQTLYEGLKDLVENHDLLSNKLVERTETLRQELSAYFADLRQKILVE